MPSFSPLTAASFSLSHVQVEISIYSREAGVPKLLVVAQVRWRMALPREQMLLNSCSLLSSWLLCIASRLLPLAQGVFKKLGALRAL
jgi:hypothetical protein